MHKILYIHAGFPKTGSTSLQHFCVEHRARLRDEYDVLYPETGVSLIAGRSHVFLMPPKEAYWRMLRDEIDANPTGKVLISGESNVAKVPTEREEQDAFVRLIREYLPEYDIRSIIYLRRMDDELKSFFNQQLKNGCVPVDALPADYGASYDEFINIKLSDRISNTVLAGSLPANMAAWQRMFGKENVVIRLYDRALLKNGNVIDDLFDFMGIDISGLATHKERNVKAPDETLGLLSILFPFGGMPYDPTDSLMRKKVLHAFSPLKQGSNVGVGEEAEARHLKLLDIFEEFVPGYKDLFQERKCSFALPEIDLDPREIVKFDMLFSLFYQNRKQDEALGKIQAVADSQAAIKQAVVDSQAAIRQAVADSQAEIRQAVVDSKTEIKQAIADSKLKDQIVADIKRAMFPNLMQRLVLLGYRPILKMSLSRERYTVFRKNPVDFLASPDHRPVKKLRKILRFFGPIPPVGRLGK